MPTEVVVTTPTMAEATEMDVRNTGDEAIDKRFSLMLDHLKTAFRSSSAKYKEPLQYAGQLLIESMREKPNLSPLMNTKIDAFLCAVPAVSPKVTDEQIVGFVLALNGGLQLSEGQDKHLLALERLFVSCRPEWFSESFAKLEPRRRQLAIA